MQVPSRDERSHIRCPICGSGRIRRSMPRTGWEHLVRAITPLHLYMCRDCEHRGWRFGSLPDVVIHSPDQQTLGLPSRPVERRDNDAARRRWRRAIISFVFAVLLGALFGRYVHSCQQPPLEQVE